ncbi:mannose-6-phosphate isomerase [Teratosphaeria nubilosa]|uniref:Mannose-6-phosphate isomerase n=1 Tax=Teratosphaeria nubilosa TaxID=161662 RepID=A0A6G1L5E8_9PEZI|nr:mannose-6-phosphate isomerase [Teratosphaeria nubilosa]
MSNLQPIYQLKCSCNQYPWGKQGSNSVAARLCPNDQEFKIDENKPYAEMWMGTYPVLPSYVADSGEDLQDLLDKHPKELVGQETIDKFGHSKLPYLPKVLSIAKALPLQLHPNKSIAAQLHEKKPDEFTDPNHKPEIAVALTEFEAFCGFKPLKDIGALMKLGPLKRFLPTIQKPDFDDQTLKGVVRQMLEADDKTVKEVYKGLTSMSPSDFGKDTYIPKLAPRLAEQYDETDPGIHVALITMNYLVLQPGQSIYIPADGIHAYLSGDIIECMARSNNVLNTGFCPRADRDNVELFCSCLTFTPHSAEECLLREFASERSQKGKSTKFSPPMSEFDMLQTRLEPGEKESLKPVAGPGVLIQKKGGAKIKANGKEVDGSEGTVWFVPQGTELDFEAGKDGLLAHMAYVQ